MRTDDTYKTFLDFATKTSTDLGVAEPVLPRPRKVSRRLGDGASQCYQSSSVQEHYSRLYYEAMDLAITSIKDRFDQPGFHMYRNLETHREKTRRIILESLRDWTVKITRVCSITQWFYRRFKILYKIKTLIRPIFFPVTVLVNAANKKEYIEELKEILAFYSDDFNEAELRTQILEKVLRLLIQMKGTSILCNKF